MTATLNISNSVESPLTATWHLSCFKSMYFVKDPDPKSFYRNTITVTEFGSATWILINSNTKDLILWRTTVYVYDNNKTVAVKILKEYFDIKNICSQKDDVGSTSILETFFIVFFHRIYTFAHLKRKIRTVLLQYIIFSDKTKSKEKNSY